MFNIKVKATFTVSRHRDGDTVEAKQGSKIFVLRQRNSDAPELNTRAGKLAKANIEKRLPTNTRFSAILYKNAEGKYLKDKYNRVLADY